MSLQTKFGRTLKRKAQYVASKKGVTAPLRYPEALHLFIRRFRARYKPGSKGALRAREPIAEFCGVTPSAVTRWFSGTGGPMAEQRISLICYLVLNGYRVFEFQDLPLLERELFELIGYGVVTIDQAKRALKFRTSTQLYQLLDTNHPRQPREGQIELIEKFCLKHRKKLERARVDAQKLKLTTSAKPAKRPWRSHKVSTGVIFLHAAQTLDALLEAASDQELLALPERSKRAVVKIAKRFQFVSTLLNPADQFGSGEEDDED